MNQHKTMRANLFFLLLAVVSTQSVVAAQPLASTDTFSADTIELTYDIPTIRILGEKPRLLGNIPGSATYIDPKQLQSLQPISGNEVLRTVPGVNVVEEEGAGLRLNLGIRGLDPDRSSRVLVLEDGVPVALNPFGEPQMYYTPVIDRMQSIEVLKGSGQLLFGPQTIGGVVNYITADPPEKRLRRIRLTAGQNGYFSSLLSLGNTVNKTGFRIDYLRKQADNMGPTAFRLDDLTGKMRFELSERSSVGVKLGFYNELSNATYIGLTQSMFDAGGQDFARLAPDDHLHIRRVSASIHHEYRFRPLIQLKTTAFGYTTSRNWMRQDFSSNPNASNQTGVVWGDPTVPGGAIYMRRGNGHRDRQFEVAGIEPRLSANFVLFGKPNKLDMGVRYLYERAFEQRVNGSTPAARSGALVDDEIRTGHAFSAYVQQRFDVSDKLYISGGLRSETYAYERDILRQAQKDTSIVSNATISVIIPGVGANYNINDNWTLFAGIHRGFSPPRVKDAIANSGEVYNLDPELSWNSELGVRSQFSNYFSMELTAFQMDFSNQIIPISESSGGSGSGLVNGGRSMHRGFEGGINWDAAPLFSTNGQQLELMLRLTYVDAFYNSDRFVEVDGEIVNIRNFRTPYAPEWSGTAAIGYTTAWGLQARFTANYNGGQFTDEANTLIPAANGQTGWLDPWFTLDGSLQYQPNGKNFRVQFSVKNITNERFIVTRRPQGIRVSLPRFISAGVEYSF